MTLLTTSGLFRTLARWLRPIIELGRLLRDCARTYRRLHELGILGMNQRNAVCILDHNPRCRFPIVDDKLRMYHLCRAIGVPTPEVYAVFQAHAQLRHLAEVLADRAEFVVKPARGSAGRGVLVVMGRGRGTGYLRHNGEVLSLEALRQHLSDIISGMYSLGGQPDTALIQQRLRLHPALAPYAYKGIPDVRVIVYRGQPAMAMLRLHPALAPYAYKGIPDVRVIVYRGQPAMAMLRLPTRQSGGRANLHQGGIGVGIDLDTGRAIHAVQHNRALRSHPDTGIDLLTLRVPAWPAILRMSCLVAEAVGLGYVGVDIVLDAVQGPMLLEANARPGLAIQIANGQGLVPRLRRIDAALAQRDLASQPSPTCLVG